MLDIITTHIISSMSVSGLDFTISGSTLGIAPESIRFEADLSGTTFDTGQATGTEYDPSFHKLDYYWTFGDPGEYLYTENVRPAWKNRDYGRGKWCAHCYDEPGTYTVTLFVFEPSSGKFASVSKTVTVDDPDTFYAGTATICFYNTGDTAGDIPAGAVAVEADAIRSDNSIWTTYGGGTNKRFLFKRGGTFEFHIAESVVGYTIGSYGSGALPNLTNPTDLWTESDNNNRFLNWTSGVGELRVHNVSFVGNYDPADGDWADLPQATQETLSGTGFRVVGGGKSTTITGTTFRNVGSSTLNYIDNGGTEPIILHVNNVKIYDFGGQYTTFLNMITSAGSSVAYTGVAIVQKSDAVSGEGNFRASVRQSVQESYFIGCDFFHRDPSQGAARMLDKVGRDGARMGVYGCAFEAGLQLMSFNGETATWQVNAVVEENYFIGQYRTGSFIQTKTAGLTFRNNACFIPATQFLTNPFSEVVKFEAHATVSTLATETPTEIYNNTVVNLRTAAQNNSKTPVFVTEQVLSVPYTLGQNILHQPNIGLASEYAPFDLTTLGFDSRNIGYIDPTTPGIENLDATRATPAGSLNAYLPATGSTALGAATGLVAYRDITGAVRPASKDIGAWQVTA